MWKFEYETVLDVIGRNIEKFNINNNIKYNSTRKLVELKNMPLDFSKKIYKKYPNYRKNISVTSNMIDIEPKYDNCTYYINSLDSLLMYLIEMRKYYYSSPNERDLNFEINSEFGELKALVIEKIIEKINPYKTVNDWVRENINGNIENYTISDESIDKEIKSLLDKLDNNVNPFMNNNDKLLKPIDYLNNVDFSYNLGKYSDFFIRDKQGLPIMHYIRTDDFMLYSIYYKKNEIEYHVKHEYNIIDNKVIEKLRLVELTTKNDEIHKDLEYNITNGSIVEGKQLYNEPSQMHKSIVAILLSEAVEASNKVTLDNMIKGNNKVLERKS